MNVIMKFGGTSVADADAMMRVIHIVRGHIARYPRHTLPVVVVSASGEVREELPFHLREYLKYDDLFRYGITPQFVSRFESIVVLNDLSESDLARIFYEPEGSIFRTSRDYFARFGVDLKITRGALVAIAWDAARQKRLGARALRETFRRVVRDLEYDPAEGGGVVTIDEEMVKKAIGKR